MALATLLGVVLALVAWTYAFRLYLNKNKLPLPPGPTPLPIVGNIKDLPPAGSREWEHWLKHKEAYGPITSVSAFGSTIILLHDAEIAKELLEKRSNIHSARPHSIMANELCGFNRTLATRSPDARMRTYRKHIHATLGTNTALTRAVPLQEVEVDRFLLRVLRDPDRLLQHIRTEAGAIILDITYGYTIETEKNDILIDMMEQLMEDFADVSMPGKWLVDTIPPLKYLPEWCPGAGFQKTAAEMKFDLSRVIFWPMRFVKSQMKNKVHRESITSKLVEAEGEKMTAEQEELIADSASNIFGGGADTSVATLQTFFLAMVLYPEVQRKAREEIDRAIGTHRLPNFEDRPRLPYVTAVAKEAFRWQPVAPLGLPHMASTDDTINGYLIPKGAVLIPNIWWFTHDPATYKDPMVFNPERFLGDHPEKDPSEVVFGYGRRICPGKLLADSSVWLTVAKSLAALDIAKATGTDGKEIVPEAKFSGSIISHPEKYKAAIKPRDAVTEALIREIDKTNPSEKSSVEALLAVK